jgi:hypothetical protein
MKPLLPFVTLVVSLSSCASYQYATLSADKTTKNEAKELVYQNDTLQLAFNFNGPWGTFRLTAFNKTDQPISINWQKSSVIYNNASYSLFEGAVKVNGEVQRNQLYNGNQNVSPAQPVATVNGSFTLPSAVAFIPPHTFTSQVTLDISKVVPSKFMLPANLPNEKLATEAYTVKFKKAVYDSSSTPFKFKLFLTFAMGSSGQEFYSQQTFYVTEIKQTNESGIYQVLINSDGDKFYYRLTQ